MYICFNINVSDEYGHSIECYNYTFSRSAALAQTKQLNAESNGDIYFIDEVHLAEYTEDSRENDYNEALYMLSQLAQ